MVNITERLNTACFGFKEKYVMRRTEFTDPRNRPLLLYQPYGNITTAG